MAPLIGLTLPIEKFRCAKVIVSKEAVERINSQIDQDQQQSEPANQQSAAKALTMFSKPKPRPKPMVV